jgi:hypothetical protein
MNGLVPGLEPVPGGLRVLHEHGLGLAVSYRGRSLLRYVYRPWDAQLESPRPYFHPLSTLGGDVVSLYRPHDHVWHKGLALSLPNVGPANFWGGVTYTRGHGYQQLPNDGAMVHKDFEEISATDQAVRVAHRLDWITEQGETWFDELRRFDVRVAPDEDHWVLTFETTVTNVSGHEIVIGSPTTEGRDNAGYGGLFWRGPRSFTGGKVYVPGRTGGDELMGVRAPWLGFGGCHDEHGRWSTVVFVDASDNGDRPTKWFVRSELFACVCPAPFFDTEVPVAPGGTVGLRYAVVIADGDRREPGAARLAVAGFAALADTDERR